MTVADQAPDNTPDRNPEPLLRVRGLRKWFPIKVGVFSTTIGHVKAVDDVDLDVFPGECLGLVGESGSGKTTLGRCLLRAMNATGGQALYQSRQGQVDLVGASSRRIKRLRRELQMIFQDPYASLNPRMTVFDVIGEPLLAAGIKDRAQRKQRVGKLLKQVGLNPEHMRRYPHAFSGGQRQRIGIARALALSPRLIVADEPVSALDVSVQAQILNLLAQLKSEMNLTYLFIAHDLGVVRHLCDRVAVMYVGRIVEIAPTDRLFREPRHPYTQALLKAIPEADPHRRFPHVPLTGEVADPSAPPSGCAFHPRCSLTRELAQHATADQTLCIGEPARKRVMARCVREMPELAPNDAPGACRCHFADQMTVESQSPPADGQSVSP